ncbi:unnamed protein product [Trichobilharzia regenti]|nr:unnamed protein product [Trichobilharzia regenti]
MIQLSTYWLIWTRKTFADMFKSTVRRRGSNKVAIYYEDQVWTFGALDAYSNRVANHLLKYGFKRGDVLLLFMHSCPSYIGIWLGAAKIGVATGSLLNETFEMVREYGEFSLELMWIVDERNSTPEFAISNSTPSKCSWNMALAQASHSDPPPLPRTDNHREHLIYVYTSGTTGFPKVSKKLYLVIRRSIVNLQKYGN